MTQPIDREPMASPYVTQAQLDKAFPEPDFTKAHKVLRENGMTLDAISASNMRHVIKGVREIIDAARGKP